MPEHFPSLGGLLLFYKATAKKQVWIPQFVKNNGQVVGGHYAMVHVADDHDHHKVAGGSGTYSQKKAHAALKDEPAFHKLAPEAQAAVVMHHATQIQDAESAAARLATLKKKLLAGQPPTFSEWKHFHAAPVEKQQAITAAVHAAGQSAGMDINYAAWLAAQPKVDTASANVDHPPPAGKGPAENLPLDLPAPPKPAPQADEGGKAPAAPEDAGPKEGDTKEGVDGQLVFKDGHWHKEDPPAGHVDPGPDVLDDEDADSLMQGTEPMSADEWEVFKKKHYPNMDAMMAQASAEPDDTKAVQAMVDAFHDAKLPPSNSNAKSFNPKMDAIIAAVQAGDKDALLAMSYGTNTYGKKAAKLANEALNFLGSRHQVAPGQKAGQHPTLQAAPAPAPAVEPAPAAASAPPAPAGLAVPALEGASAGVKAVLAEAQQHFAAKDIAKLDLIEASTNGLASYAPVHAWAVAALAHLEAELEANTPPVAAGDDAEPVAPDPALIEGWKAAIGVGKPPTKTQALAMDALEKVNPDEHLDHMAEAHVDLGQHLGLIMEGEESATLAENKMLALHAAGLATPGLEAAEIPKPSNWTDKEIASAAKRVAMLGDLATLQNMAEQAFENDETGNHKYLVDLISKLTVKQKQAADLAAAAADAVGLTDAELPDAGKGTGKIAIVEMQEAAKKGDLTGLNLLVHMAWEDGEQGAHGYGTQLQAVLAAKQDAASAEQGPKEGDTKQGADGMLIFQDGRWHKIGTNPQLLKIKAAKVVQPTFKGTNAIKMSKIAKALYTLAQQEGAPGLAKAIKDSSSPDKVVISAGGYGFVLNKDGTSNSANGNALVTYAAQLQAEMSGTISPVQVPKPGTSSMSATISASLIEKVGNLTALVADSWAQTGPQAGSNPGGRFKDAKGQEWYCKFAGDPDTVKNELLAAKFYQMLGMEVPELRLVKRDGKLGIASKWVDGLSKGDAAALAGAEGAHKGFVFDAWLANWDVVGLANDNMLLKDGKAVRIDVGGALAYRAMGGKKGDAFGESVPELDTLLDPAQNANAAAVFGKITPADLASGGEVLAKMHPNQIDKLCRTFGPGTRVEQEALATKLAARREFILKKLGIVDPWNAPAPDITKLQVNPADLPPPIDFNNYPGKGGGLSSKKHINDQNTADDAALIDFAKEGNLAALQAYHYDAYDKETGAYLGKKPIGDHPSKDIKNHHAALCDLLTAIAHPPVAGLDLPPIGGGSIEEVSEAAGAVKPGGNIKTVSPDKVIGFWMKLGHVGADAVKDLMPEKTSYLNTAFVTKAKNWYKGASQGTKALVNSVLNSGAYNRFWNNGDKHISITSHGHSYSGGAQSLAKQVYDDAFEFEGGETVGRWMNLPETMKQQLLNEGAGLVFQNADSMCTSIFKNWGDNAKFGSGAFLNIRFAKGAKAMASLGSGRFSASTTNAAGEYVYQGSGEMEITTLMGQRFVVLEVKQGNASSPHGITLELLALPPHEGYTAELGNMAQMGKALANFPGASMSMFKAMVVFVKRFAKKI